MNNLEYKTFVSFLLAVLLISSVYAQFYDPYSSSSNYQNYNQNYYNENNYNDDYYAGYNNNNYRSQNQGSGYTTYPSDTATDYYQNSYPPNYGDASYGYSSSAYGSGYSGGSNYYQSSRPTGGMFGFSSMNSYWPQMRDGQGTENCNGATTDFIVAIPPGACTPNVVRSDLLAEQNVPVFCKLSALKLNPLIDVSAIQSISFSGDYSNGVAGVSYHPARQAVRTYNTLLSSPYMDNAGYVVISLSRQANERDLPDFVEGNLTARIRYDARNLFGTGLSEYYLEADEKQTPFWHGKGFLGVEDVNRGIARINVYTRKDAAAYRTITLREGQESGIIYFPGYYCSAGVRLRLNRVVAPDDMALLNIEGDQIWVREGSRFLDNKCIVQNINIVAGGTGNIIGSCFGKRFDLKLGGRGAVLNNEGESREYAIGEGISSSSGNYFLAFYGENPDGENFVVLTKNKLDNSDLAFINKHFSSRDWSDFTPEEFEASLGESFEGKSRLGVYKKDYFIIYSKDTLDGIGFDTLSGTNVDEDPYNVGYEISMATELSKELVTYFPTEEKMDNLYWGEEALFQQIELSGQSGHLDTQDDLIELFIQSYPSSDYLEAVLTLKRKNSLFDSSNSHTSLKVNNEFVNIFVESFRAQKDLDKSATIRIGGRSAEFVGEGDILQFEDGKITIEKIDVSGVHFLFTPLDASRTQGRFIGLESYGLIGGREVEVRDIESRQVAYVSVIPQLQKDYSEAHFSFKIGIEDRNIKLNPDKTKDAIKGLNQTIAMWDDILEKLANVIKVWKATCFATSSILMLETMLNGFDGESLARGKVMSKYKNVCDIEISKGSYKTRTECYNAISEQINSDVNKMTGAINSVNEKLDNVQQGNTQTKGVLGRDSVVNQTKYVNDLKKQLKWDGMSINGIKVEKDDLTKSTEVSSVMLYQELGCSVEQKTCNDNPSIDVACCSALEEMTQKLGSAAIQKKANEDGKRVSENIKNILGGNPSVQIVNSEGMRSLTWNGQTGKDFSNIPSQINQEDKIQVLNLNGKTYLLKLKDSTLGGSMGIESAYILNSQNKWELVKDLRQDGLNKFVFMGGSKESCSGNIIKNPELRFYESGRNKGLPALVPFDVQNGWYVYVPNSQGSLIEGTQKTYTAAGDVNFFWICNAGKNGIIEQKSGDDLCQSFSSNQMGFDTFISCGLEGRDVGRLYARARDSIQQAAQAYGRQGYVDIMGQNLKTGTPLSDTGGTECQDFMSPNDCKMLFNTCDPVICPASRCDLGGKYPVSDVVQTGIVGSIALCLPNAREGIIFPVCLTGIHAGLDAFVSILRSEKECLEHNLETGEYVGICDEITAIYMCEFFWRQIGPLLDTLLPTFFESVFKKPATRGGGEYLTIQAAWDNLGKSMNFFTGFYAENALTAFHLRSSENIGTEVCNGFLGTSIPVGLSAEGFDALLSPQSPTQFYAYFSEVPFTDKTAPATSHYKVYYHIFAGNDFGASYQVYLKNPPASGFYASMPSAQVKTGFVARGQSADEAIDFTAPSGYKELCVRINNEEHCGFETVTSNFLVNYASEKYTQNQATKTDIMTQEECLSTSASAWGLVAPNLQAGAEKSIGGRDINLAGITRICASQNPQIGIASPNNQIVCSSNSDCGSGFSCEKIEGSEVGNCVDRNGGRQQSQGRWIDVGYCDDSNVRCWLDSSTLKDRFNAIDAVNQEIYGVDGTVEDYLKYGQMFDDVKQNYEMARAKLSEQYNRITRLSPAQLIVGDSESEISDIIKRLDEVIGIYSAGEGTSNNKAEALALKATIYRLIVEQKMRERADVVSSGAADPFDNSYISVDPINPSSDDFSYSEPKEPFDDSYTSVDPVNPNINPSTSSEPFLIRLIAERQYIMVGTSVSKYFLMKNGETVLILKNAQGSSPAVGRIESSGKIIINQDHSVKIGSRTLGDLDGTFYTEAAGFYA